MDFAVSLIAALGIGVALDWALGDPSNRFHPVAWLGRMIASATPKLKGRNGELARGSAFAILMVALSGAAIQFAVAEIYQFAGSIVFILASAVILKVTIAVKGMERHAREIMVCLQTGNLIKARESLSMIVRRDTKNLSEKQVLSATIECIGESTVDGILGPIFYFSVLGPAGALAYRVINTLDSMIGYKDEYYRKIGWMSARLDTCANYVPARITGFLVVIAAKLVGADWQNSLEMLHRDHTKTQSPNAGYPMASMAGALRVRLEKVDHYSLGDEIEPATLEKCSKALSIMKLTVILFCFLFSAPAILILYFAGWWQLFYLGWH